MSHGDVRFRLPFFRFTFRAESLPIVAWGALLAAAFLLDGIVTSLLGGLLIMLLVMVAHGHWWPGIPSIGFWWSCVLALLLKFLYDAVSGPDA